MNIQPKAEPGSPPGFHSTNPNDFEKMSIHELVMVLRRTCQWETFDSVETVLGNRYMRLREELHLEKLSRLYAESEFKKREEICEKGKKVQESYEALLKEVKVNRLANSEKKNELEEEVEKLKKKCVDSSNEIDVLRRKNGELEAKILELKKLNVKRVEDDNQLGVLRKMIGKLEHEVSELRKSKKKWLDDSDAFDVLRNKVRALEGDKNVLAGVEVRNGEVKETVKKILETISRLGKEKSKLADEKRKIEILLGSMYKKFRGLVGRLSRLEDDTNLLKSVGVSGGGNNEGKSPVDPMAANIEDKDEEDFLDDEFGNDTVVEAAPLPTNEDANHTLGVAASTQLQSKGNKDVQGSSSASGRVKLDKNIEIIYLDDDDDDADNDDDGGSMSRGVHEKKAVSGIAVKNEVPSPSVATQQKSKFPNAVDTAKRKFSLSDIEISSATSSSSDDSSFLDDLPIRSVVSLERRKKCRQTEQD